MPWTPEEFKRKHFKKASHHQAQEAASIAEAMLMHGADEGVAIATAIKHAKHHHAEKRSTHKKSRRRKS